MSVAMVRKRGVDSPEKVNRQNFDHHFSGATRNDNLNRPVQYGFIVGSVLPRIQIAIGDDELHR